MARVMIDLTGVILAGDGLVGLLIPTRHVQWWRGGPCWWRGAMAFFAGRPHLTRAIAGLELIAGIWIGTRSPSV